MTTLVKIKVREIGAPFSTVDFSEKFKDYLDMYASVSTVSGKTYFDDTGVGTNITHEIGVRYDDSITAESWVVIDGRRLDILTVENLDERNEWLRLRCTDKGTSEASKV